ncbi:TrbC/VirB2 family protein [Candidatus Dojkabacteria bacterium]|jgi:type IV secretory pathway VirB2 component (pilin)|nr:TrbC/VirB2 family protein [Candidatus Dojkabacteria bacterium]
MKSFFIDGITRAGFSDVAEFVKYLINFATTVSVLLVVIAVIIAGFKYIFSRGDDEKVKEATKTLAFALVGLVLVFIAPMIVKFVLDNFIGLK